MIKQVRNIVIDPVLADYGVDLTAKAREGKLDVVWGREDEITRATQVLCRRKKNNLLLIGEPGVGKTSIAEGIALRISEKNIARKMHDKVIFNLNITAVLAGTQFRGQMEKRMKQIIDYLKENKHIIVFIDEIHSMIEGTGSSSGMSIGNILKPALSSGDIQVIGATTLDEATKHFEKDGGMNRRFQRLIIEPSSIADTIKILQSCKAQYENYHNVTYTDELLAKVPALASKYITDRFLPDSAIDLLDEAGSKAQLESGKTPARLLKLEKELDSMLRKKFELIKSEDWEKLPPVKQESDRLSLEVSQEKEKLDVMSASNRILITERDILHVLSFISKVPLEKIAEQGKDKIVLLTKALDEKIIGQRDAKERVIKALKRTVVGLHNKKKPVFSSLFLGKSGVGKTAVAKVIAETWYDGNLIRIDMSEYMEKISGTQFVGAPPGYVGYDSGGKLTEQVRRKPYSVVLLDEIEKAHPDVLNYLLQILDDGHITDGQGHYVDFTNTMIIMTSNLGCREATEAKSLGFGAKSYILEDKSVEAAKKHFSPELWNRIDSQIVFETLTETDIEQIVEIELNKLRTILAETNMKLKVHKKVKEYLAKTGYSTNYGARFLERTVTNLLTDEIVDFILENDLKNVTISATMSKEGKIVLKDASAPTTV